MIYNKAGVENNIYTNEFETDYKDNLESKITYNKLLLPGFCFAKQYILVTLLGPCLAEYHVPKGIVDMIQFDMMHYSPLDNLAFVIVNQGFLMSIANWERKSTQNICARMPKVDRIYQVITKHFRLKARSYLVSILVHFTYKKNNIYTITNTNTNKILVYHAIPIVTKGF